MSKAIPAIISMHDVMPATLARVEQLLANELADIPARAVMLLVVPGLPWTAVQLSRLKSLEQQGYELIGHGWLHRVAQVRTGYHRLHSFFISRQAAEHLSKSEDELSQLLHRNARWFETQGFNRPRCYVPPAWAVGKLSRQTLRQAGFDCIETTSGLHWLHPCSSQLLPLVGFEADTRARARFLRTWNWLNVRLVSAKRPVRVSIHPYDNEYLLADQMRAILAQVEPRHWSSVFPRAVVAARQRLAGP